MTDDPLLPAPPARALLRKSGSRRRLLLIDDELAVARFIGHAAEECGFEATITVTAESFRSQYQSCDPDVVVQDLDPPITPRAISLVRRVGRTLPPAADRFVEIALDVCAGLGSRPAVEAIAS